MKKIIIFCLFLTIFVPMNIKAGVYVSAHSAIVMELESGRIVYSKNIHDQKLIASTTKILTAVVAIESGKLDEIVTINKEILTVDGSSVYLQVGDQIKLRDLVYGLMLRSGNDAAVAIGQYVSGSVEKFVDAMIQKASDIGMKESIFVNPHGLDEKDGGNYSTAYDMALLMRYAMKNDTFREISSSTKHSIRIGDRGYLWYNKNRMLSMYEYTTGGKTGYTKKAGRTLVTSAKKDNIEFVCVTLDASNDWDDHIHMYNDAFAEYKLYDVISNDSIVKKADYSLNHELYVKNSFYFPLTQQEENEIYVKYELLNKKNRFLDDDAVGTVTVYFKKQVIHTEKIYIHVLEKRKRNVFTRFFDYLRDLF